MLHMYSSIYKGDWSPASSRLLNPFLCREAIPFSKGKTTEGGAKSRKWQESPKAEKTKKQTCQQEGRSSRSRGPGHWGLGILCGNHHWTWEPQPTLLWRTTAVTGKPIENVPNRTAAKSPKWIVPEQKFCHNNFPTSLFTSLFNLLLYKPRMRH